MGDLDNIMAETANEAHWDTIALFEQILEHAPEDASALRELFHACIAVGETARAVGYGKSLAKLALRSNDTTRIRAIHDLLVPYAESDKTLGDVTRALADTLATADASPDLPEPVVAPSPVSKNDATPAAADVSDTKDLIALVSKILENMPDDRESLEMLATAYLKEGDGVQAANTLARLADVLIRDQDAEEAAVVYEKLVMLQQVAPDAVSVVERLAHFLKRAPATTTPTATEPKSTATSETTVAAPAPPLLEINAARRRAVFADEMELLWDLQQQGLITDAQYASVVNDLTELTSSDTITTISALHGLSFRSFAGLDALLVQLATKATTPIISLQGFDLQSSMLSVFPLDYLTFQGVVPFEKIGEEFLVAVLNPFSQRLRKEVAAALGNRCHFYLISPADFDAVQENIKNHYAADAK